MSTFQNYFFNKIQNFLLEIVTIVIYWSFVTMSLLSFVINSMHVCFWTLNNSIYTFEFNSTTKSDYFNNAFCKTLRPMYWNRQTQKNESIM